MINIKEPKFSDLRKAINYAYDNKCRLSLEDEQLISYNVYYSFLYARNVLKYNLGICRFELAEETFSRDHYYSYYYAIEVLESRFHLGESVILDNAYYYCSYINNIFKGLIPLDFLELCSPDILELLLDDERYKLCHVQGFSPFNADADGMTFSSTSHGVNNTNEILNKDDIIRVLFKKRFLE